MKFYVSNLKTRVLNPTTHSYQFNATCGKIRYVSEWPLKTNRPSFFLILQLSHALDGLFSVLSGLHGHKHKCAFCWMKDHRTWLLSDIVAWDSFSFWDGINYLFLDIIDAMTATFHDLVYTCILNFRLALMIVLRALFHLIYLVIFNNFLVFNCPFFNFEQ